MIPGSTGLSTPSVGELVDEAHVVLGLEEELGDREVGAAQLVGEVARSVSRSGERGWTSGCAATPIEKWSNVSSSSISSLAYV